MESGFHWKQMPWGRHIHHSPVEAVPWKTVPREAACIARTTSFSQVYWKGYHSDYRREYGIELHIQHAPQETDINIELSVTYRSTKIDLSFKRMFTLIVLHTRTYIQQLKHAVCSHNHVNAWRAWWAVFNGIGIYTSQHLTKEHLINSNQYQMANFQEGLRNEFSFWATIWWWWGWPISFFVGVFYSNTIARVVVMKDLKAHTSYVKDQCHKAKLKLEFEWTTMYNIDTKKLH